MITKEQRKVINDMVTLAKAVQHPVSKTHSIAYIKDAGHGNLRVKVGHAAVVLNAPCSLILLPHTAMQDLQPRQRTRQVTTWTELFAPLPCPAHALSGYGMR